MRKVFKQTHRPASRISRVYQVDVNSSEWILRLYCVPNGGAAVFYAHVRALTVSDEWMSGLNPVDFIVGRHERCKVLLHGCTTQIVFLKSGLSCKVRAQPTWLSQTHLGLPELGSPTLAS